jgi:lysophospholipase L1-like esterase
MPVARAHDVDVVHTTWAHSPARNDRASTPHYQRGFDENNAVVKEVAADQGVKLFEFDALMPTDKSYWGDGFHVNEEGAALKAELFAKFIHDAGLIAANT